MGSCNKRVFLFTVCILQVISIFERQVFDFLGYQWLPIAANFFHILLVIIGFFGGYQYRRTYLIVYVTWQIVWLAWNSFVICYYLNVGVLDRDSDILNLGTGAASWWEVNGIGCRPFFSANGTSSRLSVSLSSGDPIVRPPRPDLVDGCLVDYQYVEVIHAAIQCVLAVFAFLSGLLFLKSYSLEDDSFDYIGDFSDLNAGHPAETYLRPTYVRNVRDEPDSLTLSLLADNTATLPLTH